MSDQGWTGATETASAPATPAPGTATVAASPSAAATPSTPVPTATAFPSTSPSATTTTVDVATDSDAPVTLFGRGKVAFGGYGALGVRYARLNDFDTALVGAEGAFLLDHRLAIGIAGYGASNERRLSAGYGFERPYMHFGYGGLLLRYHVFIPQSPVAISVATLVGGGAVGLTDNWEDDVHRDNADLFFIFEPQLGAHINVTRWMRVGVDAGYRFVSGIGRFGFSESDFRGASVGGSVGFGWF